MTNVACIGAGYWGKNLIRNFSEIGALHTICDGNRELLESYASKYPNINLISNIEEVLADDDIDAVCLATPAETHYSLIKQALLSGKHVYAEKPLCLQEDHAEEVIALAKDKNLTLMVGHLLWYHPMVLEIKRQLGSGELGKLRYVYSNRLNMGLLRSEENVLWSFAPHDISMILGLVGEQPVSVSAHSASFLQANIEDYVVGCMEFQSGVKAHVFVSWLNPFKEQKLVVVGEKSMLVFDDTLPWEKKLARYAHDVGWSQDRPMAVKAEPEYIELPQSEPLKNECKHFVQCVGQRSVPRTDGSEGLRVLSVLNKLQQAIA